MCANRRDLQVRAAPARIRVSTPRLPDLPSWQGRSAAALRPRPAGPATGRVRVGTSLRVTWGHRAAARAAVPSSSGSGPGPGPLPLRLGTRRSGLISSRPTRSCTLRPGRGPTGSEVTTPANGTLSSRSAPRPDDSRRNRSGRNDATGDQGALPLPGCVSSALPGRVPANSVMMPLASGALPVPGAPRRIPGPARQPAGSARAASGRLPMQPAAVPEVTVSSAA